MDNMTAKVSCFARAYHYINNQVHIFKDSAAEILLGEEYEQIAENMSGGISFFLPGFQGTKEEGLRLIVDHQLSPSVLGRSAFCEKMLDQEKMQGCKQYVLLASGYDTYSIRNQDETLSVFELDLPELITDKLERITRIKQNAKESLYQSVNQGSNQNLNQSVKQGSNQNLSQSAKQSSNRIVKQCMESIPNTKSVMTPVFIPCNLADPSWNEELLKSGFEASQKSFTSLLGISYYLTKSEFCVLLQTTSKIMAEGSAICFDYPTTEESREAETNRQLAKGAGEQMKAMYSEAEIKEILENCDFKIETCLEQAEMTKQYFSEYNRYHEGHEMQAPVGVGYIFAKRKRI